MNLSCKQRVYYEKETSLPDNVGGRFSVLSTIGLVPLALCGIEIQELLNGAKI